jgi:hypothetical protein
MPTRLTEWMYFKRGARIKHDDDNTPGYLKKSDAERDDADFRRGHPSVVTKIYNIGGIVNGKKVSWWNIIYKNRLYVKPEHPLRWNVSIEVEDLKTGRVFVEREQIMAKNKTEIDKYVHGTKWARYKKAYKIKEVRISKETRY